MFFAKLSLLRVSMQGWDPLQPLFSNGHSPPQPVGGWGWRLRCEWGWLRCWRQCQWGRSKGSEGRRQPGSWWWQLIAALILGMTKKNLLKPCLVPLTSHPNTPTSNCKTLPETTFKHHRNPKPLQLALSKPHLEASFAVYQLDSPGSKPLSERGRWEM